MSPLQKSGTIDGQINTKMQDETKWDLQSKPAFLAARCKTHLHQEDIPATWWAAHTACSSSKHSLDITVRIDQAYQSGCTRLCPDSDPSPKNVQHDTNVGQDLSPSRVRTAPSMR